MWHEAIRDVMRVKSQDPGNQTKRYKSTALIMRDEKYADRRHSNEKGTRMFYTIIYRKYFWGTHYNTGIISRL
jgi:hypothetical protein